jgi:hypothetical protein
MSAQLARTTRLCARPWLARMAAPAVSVSGMPPGRKASTKPAYEGHIPLNWVENAVLAVGSAVKSLSDPRRGGACVHYLLCNLCP